MPPNHDQYRGKDTYLIETRLERGAALGRRPELALHHPDPLLGRLARRQILLVRRLELLQVILGVGPARLPLAFRSLLHRPDLAPQRVGLPLVVGRVLAQLGKLSGRRVRLVARLVKHPRMFRPQLLHLRGRA